MKNYVAFLLLIALAAGCATTPTGRHQLQLLSQSTVDQMGAKEYAQVRKKDTISHNPEVDSFINCVADHIIAVAKSQNQADLNWQVTVFKKNEANAFALPGGKLAVYTGILKYARNGAQLAAVLGHETGHVLAHHINARLSTAKLTQAGTDLAAVFLGGGSAAKQQQIAALLGAGAQVGVLLPFSRSQESEADLIGLYNMARAGFDPRQAPVLWQHFQSGDQKQPPVFLSDHPGNGQRIQHLKDHMDKALRYFQQARAAGKNPQCGAAPPAP